MGMMTIPIPAPPRGIESFEVEYKAVAYVRKPALRQRATAAYFVLRDWQLPRDMRPGVIVTARGHFFHTQDDKSGNEWVCRGCGKQGRAAYILDYESCANPATGRDIRKAL